MQYICGTGCIARMSVIAQQPLSFANVDGLAFAEERGRLSASTFEAPFSARDLGPILELMHLAATKSILSPNRSRWIALGNLDALCSALNSTQSQWLSPQDRLSGFYRTQAPIPRDDTSWIAFRFAAQQAAIACGFRKQVAAQLIGAIGEMQSNIYEHSDASATGLIAFNAAPGIFEFVIADRGIGILKSLKTSSRYASLSDHGNALQLVLQDGVSRHAPGTGHGNGFRPLFIGLANLNGSLRFRSGDCALTIDGMNPTLMTHKLSQKPPIAGFFASIACRFDDGGARQ